MKTKFFFSTILMLLFAYTAVFASIKQERKVEAFSKINIGSAFKVYLSQGASQSVTVEIDDEYINDVETTVSKGTLNVKLKSNNHSGNRNIHVMNVYITVPNVDSITASGAAKFQVETPIKNDGAVSFNLSGASKINEVTISCKKLVIDQSGASKCSINLTADEVNVDTSGASNLKLEGTVNKIAADASGASKVDIRNLKYNSSDFEESTAASIKK